MGTGLRCVLRGRPEHWGRPPFAGVLQALDELSATDTDSAAASATTEARMPVNRNTGQPEPVMFRAGSVVPAAAPWTETERTYVEIAQCGDLVTAATVDWNTLGAITQVLLAKEIRRIRRRSATSPSPHTQDLRFHDRRVRRHRLARTAIVL